MSGCGYQLLHSSSKDADGTFGGIVFYLDSLCCNATTSIEGEAGIAEAKEVESEDTKGRFPGSARRMKRIHT